MEHFYPYQNECVPACLNSTKGRVILPTGSGKTVIALEVIRQLSLLKETSLHLVFVPRIMLAKQWIVKSNHLIKDHGLKFNIINVNSGKLSRVITREIEQALYDILGGGVKPIISSTNTKDVDKEIFALREEGYHVLVLCTYHSNEVLLNSQFKFDSVWYDESHFLAENNNFFSATKVSGDRKYYLTATPRWTDSDSGIGMNNESVYGPEIFIKSPKEIIEAGAIVSPMMHLITTNIDLDNDHDFNPLMTLILSAFEKHREVIKSGSFNADEIGAKFLVVCNGQNKLGGLMNSRVFRDYISRNPQVKMYALSTDYGLYMNGTRYSNVFNEQKELLLRELGNLGNNEDMILFHVDMVAEGLDVPGITGVMPIRNLGKIKFLQNMGRGTRLHVMDRANLDNGVMKIGEYNKYIKPYCWVVLPYCLDNKEDFVERNMDIICSLRSDYGFDPSEHIIVDVMNPGQTGPVFDEDKLGREIRGKVINRIQECYHEIEEDGFNDDIKIGRAHV
jgi:hypothetical protein